MPKVTAQASPVSSALKPTPAAMPSGSLCKATAITKSNMRFREALLRCSSWSRPVILCMCGVTKSSRFKNNAPTATPTTASHQSAAPACSTAGTIRPRVAAASITPAQNPSTASFHLWGSSLMPKPIMAPITVAKLSPAALSHTCVIIVQFLYSQVSPSTTEPCGSWCSPCLWHQQSRHSHQ